MNSMEQDMVMTIKHLTQLLEEARKDNRELREELNMTRGLLWMKQNGKDVSGYFNSPATGEEYNIDPSSISHGGSVCDGGTTYTDTHPLGTDRYSGEDYDWHDRKDPDGWKRLGIVYKRVNSDGSVSKVVDRIEPMK